MKTIPQISKEYGIPRSTLRNRLRKITDSVLVDHKTETLITQDSLRPKKTLVKPIKPLLVYAFKEEHPYMSNEEISFILSVPQHTIDEILNNEFLTIRSRTI
jgi:Fic family protein